MFSFLYFSTFANLQNQFNVFVKFIMWTLFKNWICKTLHWIEPFLIFIQNVLGAFGRNAYCISFPLYKKFILIFLYASEMGIYWWWKRLWLISVALLLLYKWNKKTPYIFLWFCIFHVAKIMFTHTYYYQCQKPKDQLFDNLQSWKFLIS